MSIQVLSAISELELDIHMLNADIRKYERDIEAHRAYIEHLEKRFCSPERTIYKYLAKINEAESMLQKLRKTRWFVRKELVMWREGHIFY